MKFKSFTSVIIVCTVEHWSKLIFNNQLLITSHALYTHVIGPLKQQYLATFQPHILLKHRLQS